MTYLWIWRHLPGPLWVRILITLGIVLTFVTLLFLIIFPAFTHLTPAGNEIIEPDYPTPSATA